MRDRLCMYCEHFYYEQGATDYEYHDCPPILSCSLNFWSWDVACDSVTDFRFKMSKAVRCNHYKPIRKVIERGY